MNTETQKPIREQLKHGLKAAMKARQNEVVSVLRSALSAIDNAEAVPLDDSMVAVVGRLNEVPRKELSEEDMRAIVQAEADALKTSIAGYQSIGKLEEAEGLQTQWEALSQYLF
ncbi:MAG: GatB/YqeY domain-containing protein [Anaerolineales bacterium]|nr:GatB/YqeY domain-containing protein [Anaerolineales bacterium]